MKKKKSVWFSELESTLKMKQNLQQIEAGIQKPKNK